MAPKSKNVANNAASNEKKLGGCTGKGFMPGQSGNISGRPKKKPITELFERIMNNPEMVDAFELAIANSIKKGGMAGVMYMKEAADRLEGKVTQPIEADVSIHTLSERMRKAKERLQS